MSLSKVNNKAKIRIQPSTTPELGHLMGRRQNTRKHHTKESQEVRSFSAGDHKAAINRQESMTNSKHK